MGKFFLSLVFAAAILGTFVWFAAALGFFNLPSFFFKTLAFLVFSTGVIYFYLYNNKHPEFFLQLYLLTMAVKILAYCSFNIVMIFQDTSSAAGNVVFFMVTYFVFTSLEIGFLYRKITHGNKP